MTRLIPAGLVWLVIVSGAGADDTIINSKHDLSMFGPGPIRAIDEDRVCIFCHAPHNTQGQAPLWNRHNPTTHYRIYQSRTTDARIDQPGPASKQCLSCHDGSIALGATLDRPAADAIRMTHPFMPTGPSNLTNDLSDDHPIGLRYDRSVSNRDRQIRPPQLVDSRIVLGDRGELECTACHDPHSNELGNFLRITERQGALCLTCHDLDGWEISAHANSPRTIPLVAVNGTALPFMNMADGACAACHASHSAPYREQLLHERPSQLCLDCHDGLTARNVLPTVNLRSGHRINPTGTQEREPERRLRTSRYVECTDCHNPHAVAANVPRGTTGLAGQTPVIPPALRYVQGVSLAGASLETSRFYYEVCFQCHADRPVRVRDRIPRQRDTAGNIRMQFLPTVASAHPVAFPARNRGEVPSLLAQYRTQSFISCQDCHNNPDSVANGGTQANGPHGSRFEHLLVANYTTDDFTIESPQAYDLCYRCHDRNSILGDESFPHHRNHIVRGRSPCSACHDPHGVTGSRSNHSALINFDISIVGGRRFFLDTGRFSGTCTLECHGVDHVNFTYGP